MGTQRYSTLGWLPPRASGIYKLNPHGSKFPELASLITCNNLVSDKKFPVYGNKQNPSNHKRQIVATQNYPSDVNKSKLTDEGKPVTVNGHSEKKFESKSNVEKTSEEKNQDCKSEEMSCSSRKRRRKRQKNKKRDKNHKEQEKTKEPHDKPKKKDCKPWHKGTLKMEISLDLNMPCDSVPETPVPQQCPVGTHNYTIDIFSLISKNTPHNHQRHPKHKPLTPNIFPPVTQSNDVSGSCNNVQNNNWFRYRCRVPSVCESEDSFIVFDDTSDCESNGSEDLSDSEEISDSTVDIATKKVRFADDKALCEIHTMVQWSFAYQAARKGPWEEYARDRERFKKRIQHAEKTVGWIFHPDHRRKVYGDRFGRENVDSQNCNIA